MREHTHGSAHVEHTYKPACERTHESTAAAPPTIPALQGSQGAAFHEKVQKALPLPRTNLKLYKVLEIHLARSQGAAPATSSTLGS